MRPSFCVLLAESFKEWIVRMQRFVTTLKDSDLSLSLSLNKQPPGFCAFPQMSQIWWRFSNDI